VYPKKLFNCQRNSLSSASTSNKIKDYCKFVKLFSDILKKSCLIQFLTANRCSIAHFEPCFIVTILTRFSLPVVYKIDTIKPLLCGDGENETPKLFEREKK